MALIQVTRSVAIDEAELTESFLRASGARGQNIQKVETAVQLRFDARRSPNLSEPVRNRLITLAGNRMTKDGVLVITADALERLLALIRAACVPPPSQRRPTRPP